MEIWEEYRETMFIVSFDGMDSEAAADGRGCTKANGVLGGSTLGTICLQAAVNGSPSAGTSEVE